MSNVVQLMMSYKSNNYLLKALFLVFLVFNSAISPAQENSYETLVKSYSYTLDRIEHNLNAAVYDEKNLPETIRKVTTIKSEAIGCVNLESADLEKLKQDLSSLGKLSKAESGAVKEKRAELNSEILKVQKLVAGCRVILLQSEEVLNKLSSSQQGLLTARLFAQGANIISLIQVNWNKPSLWLSATHSFISNNTGFALLSAIDILFLSLTSIVALLIGLLIRKKINHLINKKTKTKTFSNHFYRAYLAVSAFYAPRLLTSLSLAVYFYVLTAKISPLPFISVIAYGLPIYFTLMALVEIFLKPRPPAEPIHNLPVTVFEGLARRLKVFLLLLFVGSLLFTTLLTQSLPEETLLLARAILIFIFVLNLIWVVRILGKTSRFTDTFLTRFGISFTLLVVLLIEFMGYRDLFDYLVFAIFGTLIIYGIYLIASRLIKEFFDGLDKGKRKWQRYIRKSLGAKSRKKLKELFWIKFIVVTALWLGLFLLVLRVWGMSDNGFQQLNFIITDGFTIGSLRIIPVKIVFAVITLIIILAISRWLHARLESNWLMRTNMDRGAREAVATISGYMGVAIAILVSLSITGVEFGNLAIIAGALSVGIGFGLQNIVNNFVSGLILLFERPIKTGDWIIAGNTEGFVKKISIRSTQIQTFDQADVIVPNSDLISGQVTNWMLRDVKGRIRVPIGVAYGSDTQLVHKLLSEVACNNSSVVVDGSVPEPKVLFMAFGDSALLFELRVFIHSIDQKFQAISDLNFAIDSIFREHNIQIPFPQRDVHIINDSNTGPAAETD